MFLLAMIMAGVVAAAGTFHKASNLNRVRQQATAIAGSAVEQARALSFNDLKLDPVSDSPNPNPPSTYADSDCPAVASPATPAGTCSQAAGTIVVGAVNCSSCIQYRYTTTSRGVTYTVTQMVIKLSSFVDGNNVTQTLKKLIIKVDWNLPKAGSTTVATILNNQDYLNAPTPTGVHVEIHDDSSPSPGATIADPNRPGLFWTVTIKNSSGTTVATGQTEDGVWDNTSLPAGAYTCTVSNSGPGGTLGFYKMGTDNSPVYSFGCNGGSAGEAFAIVDGDTTNLFSQWTESTTCLKSTTTGTVNITVTDTEGNPLQNAVVQFTDSAGTNTYNSPKTTAAGTVNFNLKADSYTYTTVLPGWTATDSTTCVYANNSIPVTVQMQDAPPAGTINVTIKNNTTTPGTAYYRIDAIPGPSNSAPPYGQTQADKGKNSLVVPFKNAPADTYTITACRYEGIFTGNCSLAATKTGVVLNDLQTVNVALTDNG